MSSRLARIEAKVLELEKTCARITPVNGIGINVSDSPTGNGRSISSIAAAGGAISAAGFPFMVTLRKDEDDNWFRGVSINSKLFEQIGSGVVAAEISITGLLTSAQPADDDAGWIATADGDVIWLELDVDFPDVTAAAIKSDEGGDNIDGGECEHDGGTGSPPVYAQTKARLIIANIGADGDALVAEQLNVTHRRMGIAPMDARDSAGSDPELVAAVYPFAY